MGLCVLVAALLIFCENLGYHATPLMMLRLLNRPVRTAFFIRHHHISHKVVLCAKGFKNQLKYPC